MYLLQNLTCLGIAGLAAIPAVLILAVRFSAFTKTQLLVLTGGFIVAGLIIAAMVNNLAGAVPCLFPALFFGGIDLMKHRRDLKHAQRVMAAREQMHGLPRTHETEDALEMEPSGDHRNKLLLPKAIEPMDNRPAKS